MTTEPRSMEEALEHLADGIAVDACDQCSSDFAFLRSKLERLPEIERLCSEMAEWIKGDSEAAHIVGDTMVYGHELLAKLAALRREK